MHKILKVQSSLIPHSEVPLATRDSPELESGNER